MSDNLPANRDLSTLPLAEAIEAYSPNFQAVLPPDVSLDHFKRMVISAVNTNPALRYCDRRTLFNACVKCASDGVLPDGREAALVPFKTKVKNRDGTERTIDAVQYMIMVAGLRRRLRNSGEVNSAIAEVVYRNDKFRFALGDNAMIEHQPTQLEDDPGPVVGAYAIITLTNGEILREVVRLRDIEAARAMSRAKDGPAWRQWYGEMSRKVALRRCAKAAPSSSKLQTLLDRDDEPELPAEPPPPTPPRPTRDQFIDRLPDLEEQEPYSEEDKPIPPPDRPREDDVSPPSEGAPTAEPSETEVERSQVRIAEVLGPEEVAKLDEEAIEAAPVADKEIEVIKPRRLSDKRSGGWDWPAYAEELITAGRKLAPPQLAEFRAANASMVNSLRLSNKEEWSRVNQALAEHERSG